jgi:hypothetical protein
MAEKNQLVVEALAPLKKELLKARDARLRELAPLEEKRARVLAEMEPLQEALRKVDAQIDAVERPKDGMALRDIGNNLAAIARQEGAITLVNGDREEK